MSPIRTSITAALLLALLTACGGGGKKDDPIIQPPPPQLGADEVQTTEGIYKGSVEGDLLVFRGLRYAAAPVGDRRFRPPASPMAFNGTRDATSFGAKCLQPGGGGPVGEEDCLFLNVWAHNDNDTRPVLVFLHPGGQNGVGGDMASVDGARLADSGDIIVVTLNRRLVVFGGLALDELVQEDARNTAGNYMVLDVIAALEWLQDNIGEFGGDPNRMVLAGESAGASLLCHMMATPELSGLISAAIIQSAACGIRARLDDSISIDTPFDTALNMHRPLLANAGCDMAADILACLRNMSATDLLAASEATADVAQRRGLFGPIIDGVVVTADPHSALMAETSGNFPLIVGATADEGAGGFSGTPPADDAAYRSWLAAVFSDPLDDQIYAIYPTANFTSAAEAYVTFWGDWIFNCVAEELARSASTGAPSYLYEFSRGVSTGAGAGFGAVHAIDLRFLFETFDLFGTTPDADDELVSDALQNAWTGMAADATAAPPYLPSGASSWPTFDPNNPQFVNFDAPTTIETVHRAGRCASLRTIIPL